ncbi:MAG: Fic family protein [Candidatus Diapherotrites archaeon]|uniref:Fic family protein n=1 Tax=Candidatus Iainarchaeum sp. TaxID=3101447 RepID=A0A8T4L987_9ARCH|nr:Fic family protein [Candidatus Diapherotrites archaeon]
MAYVEKKRIGGKEYFYLSRNIRVSPGKWKKIRKYVGADLSNLALAEKELSLVQPVRRLMTAKQMKIVDRIKAAYAAKHKIGKSLWKTEKERMVGFVYNTNAIEGNSLSYEDTKGVLEGKKPKAEHTKRDVQEVKNMKECIDFLFDYKGIIDQDLVLRLHALQMRGVHPEAGRIRKGQNIVGNYRPPPPEKVPSEMVRFFSWLREAENLLHPFELAGLVHLKFVKIHPFMDGNGRLSRLLMNHALFRNGYPLLNIFDAEKMLYYLVLREVDAKKKEKPFLKYLYNVYGNQYKDFLLEGENRERKTKNN